MNGESYRTEEELRLDPLGTSRKILDERILAGMGISEETLDESYNALRDPLLEPGIETIAKIAIGAVAPPLGSF